MTTFALAIEQYPIYEGTPPLYKVPSSYYQQDRDQAQKAGVNKHSYPLYFEPKWDKNDRKIGVLIFHGYTSGPIQNLAFQQYLFSNNIASYAIRFSGHGTVDKDLQDQRLENWLKDIEGPLNFLRTRVDEIYLYGVSVGGALSLITASNESDIKGILLQGAFVRSAINPLYTIAPVIPITDLLNINLGIAYVEKDEEVKHYCYSNNPIRTNFEVLRTTLRARRGLEKISIPILSIHAPNDNVADPESVQYIAYFTKSKHSKVFWHGAEHTPLIKPIPNKAIFKDMLAFIDNPESISDKGNYDHNKTEIFTNKQHEIPLINDISLYGSNINNGEYLIEFPKSDFGEGVNSLYSRIGNERIFGIGFTSDHLNNRINPSFGYKVDVRGVLLTQNTSNPLIWTIAELYNEFWWQHIIYVKAQYVKLSNRNIGMGYRFPIFTKVHNDLYLQGEIAVNDDNNIYGMNLYLYQKYKISLFKDRDTNNIYFGFEI
jgi:carboxylesterase